MLVDEQEEKRQLEAQVTLLRDKASEDRATWQREERLLAAAIFEVGVRIMDRRISSGPQPMDRSLQPASQQQPPPSSSSSTSSSGTLSSHSSDHNAGVTSSSSARIRPPLAGVARKEPTAANT